jgi:putative ABC transport system permease protein
MALGLTPARIAIRPLLVSAQIAILGVILGLGVGLLIGRAFGEVLQSMMPLPVFVTPFQPQAYLQAALLGLVVPLLATMIPVMRAVRVEPVEAIQTGHLVAKGGGLSPLLARLPLPGRVLTQLPLRNLLCAPRRALMTLLGIAAAIALLVLIMGALDSFDATLEKARAELIQDEPRRMVVEFDSFYPADSFVPQAISQEPAVGRADPVLMLAGSVTQGESTLDISIHLIPMESAVWRPTLAGGRYPGDRPGLLLAANAAAELGLESGDTVSLRHPRRTGLLAYEWVESEVEVSGIHQLPLRPQAYMDLDQAELMGLTGLVNALQVTPAPGISQDQLRQQLFDQRGVVSVQTVSAVIHVFEELIGQFVDMFLVIQAAAVMLAGLLAYNSTSINLDERTREVATMFAYGVRIRTVLRVAVVETLLTSLAGTALGCGLGGLLLIFMMRNVFTSTVPDIDVSISLQPWSLVTAVLVGVVVAVVTPLLNGRRLARIDIPAALRVME